jgi:hypothetical protein
MWGAFLRCCTPSHPLETPLRSNKRDIFLRQGRELARSAIFYSKVISLSSTTERGKGVPPATMSDMDLEAAPESITPSSLRSEVS